MEKVIKTQVAVLGGGPAGYSAAFRCADLGLETVLIERYQSLGGVCLNVGCIPSKALLHIAGIIKETKELANQGIFQNGVQVNLQKLQAWKDGAVRQLTSGLAAMAKMRKVMVVNGEGRFSDTNTIIITKGSLHNKIHFDHAIIAAGSRPIELPFIPHADPRVWDSTDALKLSSIPKKLLVMGGGIIGLEMATVYHALGSKIEVVEMGDQLVPAADRDVVEAFASQVGKKFSIMLSTKVSAASAKAEGVEVTVEGKGAPNAPATYDALLVAIGRTPNGALIGAEKAGVSVDQRGFIQVDQQQRTNIPHIFAVGDIVGQPMLAHKGVHEGHIAAEVIAGHKRYFDPKVIPSIAYTEPEIAWVGLTEREAASKGLEVEIAKFPWSASGRAVASGCANGLTKLIVDKKSRRIVGGAVVGHNGGELLGEIALAIEMGCDVEDIALTIHAHPTLYESIGMAAELCEGTITDLPNPKAKKLTR